MADGKASSSNDGPKETAEGLPLYIKVWNTIVKNWFLVGMILAIVVASLAPSAGATGGPMAPEITIKYVAIPFVFLTAGIKIKTKELSAALVVPHVHLIVQLISLVFIPLVCFGLRSLLDAITNMNEAFTMGFVILGALPTTVSMCNIFTATVEGNQAISLMNSSIGNLLGVVLTPATLLMYLGSTTKLDFGAVVLKIMLILLLPFFVGQCLQRIPNSTNFWNKLKPTMKNLNTVILLLLVWSTFCDTFSKSDDEDSEEEVAETKVKTSDVVAVFFIAIVLYLCVFAGVWWVFTRGKLNLARGDIAAACFCASHKTLAMGIPIIAIVYENNPNIGLISLPLLVYHPTQLVVGSLLLERIRKYVQTDPKTIAVDKEVSIENKQEEEERVDNEIPAIAMDQVDVHMHVQIE